MTTSVLMDVVNCHIQAVHQLKSQLFVPILMLGSRCFLQTQLVCSSFASKDLDVTAPQCTLHIMP